MGAILRSWWKLIKTHRITIQFAVIFLAIAIVLILIGYQFDWTGFNVYTITVKSNVTRGTTLPTNFTVYLPSKTLYDWMQLLFIPVVLAVAGFWFNHRERKAAELRAENEHRSAERRAQTERDIAQDNQRETALQEYIDKMSELILHAKLHESQPPNEVQVIARARTITVLTLLDSKRKGHLLQFLHESGLIKMGTGSNIVILEKADLSGTFMLRESDLSKDNLKRSLLMRSQLNKINLSEANLYEVNFLGSSLFNANFENANLRRAILREVYLREGNLTKVDLSDADLSGADLSGADLKDANLSGADLSGANLKDATNIPPGQLKKAKSLKGATMPDGSIHP